MPATWARTLRISCGSIMRMTVAGGDERLELNIGAKSLFSRIIADFCGLVRSVVEESLVPGAGIEPA